MKKLIIAVLAMISMANVGSACTLCGCSASNQYLGILPQSHSNFIGLQYQNRYFTSADMDGRENDPKAESKQYYNTLQLWGRYNVGRVQLFAFVPYVVNKHVEASGTDKVNGVGDITLMANVRLLGNSCSGKAWRHYLQAGGGVKLPTGAYKRDEIKYEEGLPNMQAGTHSFDFLANTNYTIMHKNTGLNLDASYTATTANGDGYKYGNRLTIGLLGFYSYKQKKTTLVPQLGLRYDVSGGDYDNYTSRLRNDMTGGHQLYASAGIQAYYGQIGLQLGYHRPIAQYYADGMVKNKYKAEAGIYFLF
ncbi:MAG: hypothetical protein JSS82_10285 [Bacteroidetes bacterium]|nr:hypothetical protein [Bacteroidota bacterium]